MDARVEQFIKEQWRRICANKWLVWRWNIETAPGAKNSSLTTWLYVLERSGDCHSRALLLWQSHFQKKIDAGGDDAAEAKFNIEVVLPRICMIYME